jgi:hypothetical protein
MNLQRKSLLLHIFQQTTITCEKGGMFGEQDLVNDVA